MTLNDLASETPTGPTFSIITKAISGGSTDDGRRRFRMTASSTIKDRDGDEIELGALQKMAEKFRQGVTIFMDHDFKHVESAYGLTDSAEIVQRGVEKDGTPIWDLDIAGDVNVPNPRALQLADSIDGGYVKLGASITAQVRKHARKPDGGLKITDVDLWEASIVGVASNTRSWAHKAAVAIKAFGLEIDDDGDVVQKAEMGAKQRNSLDESQFACPEKRKYPIHDKAHVRAALSRIGDPSNDQCGRDKIIAAARRMGIGEHSKQLDDAGLVSWAAREFPADGITAGEDGEEVFIVSKEAEIESEEAPVEATEPTDEPAVEETEAEPEEEVQKAAGKCPTCGMDKDAPGCEDGYHSRAEKSASEESTTGVQESDPETPETAPTDESETDTQVEKVASYSPEDVAELVKQAAALVKEVDRLREENKSLQAQIIKQAELTTAVSTEVELAKQVIGEVMKKPLTSKTASFVGDFVKAHDLFDPDVRDYLNKRGALNG